MKNLSLSIPDLLRRAIFLLMIMVGHVTLAAPQIDSGNVFRELIDNNQTIRNSVEPANVLEVKEARPKRVIVPLGTNEDLPVEVTQIQLVGDVPEDVPVDEISAILMAPKKISRMSQLKELAQKIEDLVHAKGYPVFRVIVPDQEIFNGRVRMLAYNGKIDKVVNIKGNPKRIDPEVLQQYFEDLIKTGGFKRLDFERTMLLINDLPGVKAKLVLNPGREPGLIDADLEVTEGAPVRWNVVADNYGSSSTGKGRLTAVSKLDDLTGVGDRLTVLGTVTTQSLVAGMLDYKRPIGVSGLVGGLNVLASNYQTSANATSLASTGHNQSYEANLSYPLILQFGKNLYADASYASRDFYTAVAGTQAQIENIEVGKVGLRGAITDNFLNGGSTFGNYYYYNGTVYPHQGYATTNPAAYQKTTFGLVRAQSLPSGFNLLLSWSGQRTDNLLDSSEQFALGGVNAVRAYGPTAVFANKANLFTAELGKDLASAGDYGVIKSSVFYDQGNDISDPIYGSGMLRGAGVSLSLQKWGYYELKAIYAHRIGTFNGGVLLDDGTQSGRVWVSLSTFF
ncbi:ShlB/FhaC/HecB family hemolysin secretion/activation protein [Polynucleobacter sp. MWH-UH2A]|nr:ShlB/FhaC/HecB family hemolysin secretion/activation protein [Polynucleobacter sp. MWH-UH2A]